MIQKLSIPLISKHNMDSCIAWINIKEQITTAQLLRQAYSVAEQLPDKKYAINLCRNRYHFLVTFCAILIRRQVNVLPPNQLAATINAFDFTLDNCYCIADHDDLITKYEQVIYPQQIPVTLQAVVIPQITGKEICVISYTSGSTGAPKAQYKTWYSLVSIAVKTQKRLSEYGYNKTLKLLATVPAQHMYGLETSILLPLQQGYSMVANTPFFPEEIAQTIQTISDPCALISTPLHLQMCLKSAVQLMPLEYILSATAPLSQQMAQMLAEKNHCSIIEIYGCTEAGTIALRESTKTTVWQTLSGTSITKDGEKVVLQAAYLDQAISLPDNIKCISPYQFELLGRSENVINIAGKRHSLEALNSLLLAIDGVEDGSFYYPEYPQSKNNETRLVAFVVSTLDKAEIYKKLKVKIDAVFLPRPLYKVEYLPRSETGKLPLQHLKQLYREYYAGSPD